MYRYIGLLITIIVFFSGCGGESKVRIISDIENGEVTIDGKIKSSIRIGYSKFLLTEGEHTVLIEKPSLDGEWIFTGKKTFQVEADKVANIEVETEKILTQKGKERVDRELKIQRELEEKLALEKEEQEKQMEIARINSWNSTEVFQNNGFIWEDSSKVKEYMFWEEANNRCNNLEFAGSKEWRLPTKKELLELYKNKDSLKNLSANNYWTSQSSSQYYRVTVNFHNADVIGLGVRTDNRSRCVRDTLEENERRNLEQAQIEKEKNELEASKELIAKKANDIKIQKEKEYIANRLAIAKKVGLSDYPKGVYIDAKNNMIWQENIDGNKRNFDDAEKYCDSLSLAGFNNWRLPTIDELKELTPKAKSSGKGKNWSLPVWSSDDASFNNNQKLIVIYKGSGFKAIANSKYRSTKNNVRCVR